jgi:hypothetical protein
VLLPNLLVRFSITTPDISYTNLSIYPFTAPKVSPLARYLCANMPIITVGSMIKIPAAARPPHAKLLSVIRKDVMKSGTVSAPVGKGE